MLSCPSDDVECVVIDRVLRSPALRRLEWILDGLDGVDGWGGDADQVLAPAFTAHVPAHMYVDVVRERARTYAPVAVVGFDVQEHVAKVQILDHSGGIAVVHCTVDPDSPHRIVQTFTVGLVPDCLTPRLPWDFQEFDLSRATNAAKLVIFSGVPGSGKSTLSDAVGRELGIPVFALDWMLGALTPFGGRHMAEPMDIGAEILTTLAVRQLALGQSAILDSPAEDPVARRRWRSLADRAGARFIVIQCVCSEPDLHRSRVEGRQRGIPGWHDSGDWADVSGRAADFPLWTDDALVVDTARPLDQAVAAVINYVR